MELYHGTNSTYATEIYHGRININRGCGEIGKGFYTGDKNYEAHNWAWHKYKTDKKVVILLIDDNDLLALNPRILNYVETWIARDEIRKAGCTCNFEFNENAIWCPVVGKICNGFHQIKFESVHAQIFLNSASVIKTLS